MIVQQVDVKEIVKSLRSGGEADALVLTGEPLYTVSPDFISPVYSLMVGR